MVNDDVKVNKSPRITADVSDKFRTTRIFFYKKPVYNKPRTRYPQITPNLRNFKNYKKMVF